MSQINCSNCGYPVSDDTNICPNCGSPLQDKQEKGKGKGKFSGIAIAIIIVLALAVIGLAVLFFLNKDKKYEGKGYSTPENALMAYASAMKDGDFDGMRSAFAIESYVENAEVEDLIDRYGTYIPGNTALFPILPGDDDFSNKVGIELRNGTIVDQITKQYLMWIQNEDAEIYTAITEEDIVPEDAIDEFFNSKKLGRYPTIRIKGQIDLDEIDEDLSDYCEGETFQKNIKKKGKSINADDYRSVWMAVEIDGEDYVLAADAVNYGGKWYLDNLQGYVSSLADAPSGLIKY